MKREGWLLLFAMLLPSALSYVYFVALGGAGGRGSSAVQMAYGAAKVIQFTFPLAFLWFVNRGLKSEIAPSSKSQACWTWLAILFGLSVALGTFALASMWKETVLADTPARIQAKVEEFGIATPARFIALAAFLCLVHSLLEEYYWRWFVFGQLRRHLAFAWAAVISGLAFTGHHLFVLHEYFPGRWWTAAVPFALGIAVGGVFWAWFYEKSGSLWGPWLSHLLVDAGIMAVGYRMVFLER